MIEICISYVSIPINMVELCVHASKCTCSSSENYGNFYGELFLLRGANSVLTRGYCLQCKQLK
jgi:hypothetical protein